METSDQAVSTEILSRWVCDARERSLSLVADLDDQQMIGSQIPTINPLLWEIAHAAWFQDHWVVQHACHRPPVHPQGARLFDSISIPHADRWNLPLPTRQETLDYLARVREETLRCLEHEPNTDELTYFVKLSVFHEDMHTEAYTYTRQTLAYPSPQFADCNHAQNGSASRKPGGGILAAKHATRGAGDTLLGPTAYDLGAEASDGFAFDNEKRSHRVELDAFAIARRAVAEKEFATFVDESGYERQDLWSADGWMWRNETQASCPVYWQRHEGEWQRRHFDHWTPIRDDLPVIHVNWYEADAFCRWAGRRLPTEAEWELACSGLDKKHYPWGSMPPTPRHAHFDWESMGPTGVDQCHAGDTPEGCRQMLGNVWEWTADTFRPYPGFVADPYKEYSRPAFDVCKVLRGGSWATRSRLLRSTWRNYYRPDRRDVFAGFRTCAQ